MSWDKQLSRTANGAIKPTLANVSSILRNDPRWGGVLRFNEFAGKYEKQKPPPFDEGAAVGDWDDHDTMYLVSWLSQAWRLDVTEKIAGSAVVGAASLRRYHPVRDFLKPLVWDGVARLETWLVDYCGAPNTEYVRTVGPRWMISAIARIMQPGCKADHVLILVGPQGLGKSTVFSILGGKWFFDSALDLGSKDAYQAIRARWIIELAELDSVSRAESSRAKAFFTSPVDTYRPSFGRFTIEVPRQCVFAGTVNHDQFLIDETGNRRYWPVGCTRIDQDGLRSVVEQLWAEAKECFNAGVKWWLEPEEEVLARVEQADRQVSDPWEDAIHRWLGGPDSKRIAQTVGYITARDVLIGGLKFEDKDVAKRHEMQIGAVMRKLKWTRRQFRSGERRVWAYEPPSPPAPQSIGEVVTLGPLKKQA